MKTSRAFFLLPTFISHAAALATSMALTLVIPAKNPVAVFLTRRVYAEAPITLNVLLTKAFALPGLVAWTQCTNERHDQYDPGTSGAVISGLERRHGKKAYLVPWLSEFALGESS